LRVNGFNQGGIQPRKEAKFMNITRLIAVALVAVAAVSFGACASKPKPAPTTSVSYSK